ncbi:MAG TPA: alpha/beta hydrolase [Caulobacteraceae bacterium]|jgi:hypothetical protein
MPRLRSAFASLGRIVLTSTLVLAVLWGLAVAAAYVFQRDLLYHPDPVLRDPDPAGPPVQVGRLTTRDGEHLVAWWLPPKPSQPAILYFGGNGDSLIGETDRLRIIARAGVGVLAVAYRGYSGSSGHPTEAGLHADAEAAYAWLAARYPPGMIVIEGHSLGSGVAVRLAAGHPARALVLVSPFTSTTEVAAGMLPWAPVRLLMQDRFESDRWIGKVRMPVLIAHGDRDGTIPFAQGQRLFALANSPKLFVRMPGGGHDDLPERGVYDRIWPFLHVTPTGAQP